MAANDRSKYVLRSVFVIYTKFHIYSGWVNTNLTTW